MTHDIICNDAPDSFPPAGHYSSSCTAGGLVFISGQLPITPDGEKRADAAFEEQVKLVLQNIDACLHGAGTTRRRLVQVRVYITDMRLWPVFNQAYAEWIGDCRPARAVAGVAHLHYGAAVEVEAIALAS